MALDVAAAGAVSAFAVRLRGVAKRHRRHGPWVLRDVDAELTHGTTIAVHGPNGVGKSTLLRLLAGVSPPTRGRRDAADGLQVGYAPDSLKPPPGVTVAAYLRHHARIRGLGRGAARDAAARLGLEALMHERLPDLSRGSLQKAVLAQALLGSPGLIVLDEPLAGLDACARDALGELLRGAAARGAAVAVADHSGACLRCDAVWHVSDGQVVVHGDDRQSTQQDQA